MGDLKETSAQQSSAAGQLISTTNTDSDISNFLWNVQKYINDYLRFGDTKAGLAVATVSAIIGALLKINAQAVFHSPGRQWTYTTWLVTISFLCLFISAVLGIIAVTPPFRQPHSRGFMYWEEIATYPNQEEYWADLKSCGSELLMQTVANHIFIVSRVCRLKYRLVRACILSGIVGAFCAGLFVVLR